VVILKGGTVSADLSRTTKDILNNANAQIDVRIVTSGMGKGPQELQFKIAKTSKDIEAVDDVFAGLMDFRNSLAKNTKRSDYAPIRVCMKRWT